MKSITARIAQEISVSEAQVNAAITLLDDGATVPFISRYRKEVTGSLDDTQLRHLEERLGYLRELEERRETILKSIVEQEKLTPELETQIKNAETKTSLEDLYLPYKPKRRTKAQIAREAGLEPLAVSLFENPELHPEDEAKNYLNPEHKVSEPKQALDGAKQILMERFSEDAKLLEKLRNHLSEFGFVHSSVIQGKESEGEKFRDYFEYAEAYKKVPSHRALAMFRARNEGVVNLHLDLEEAPEPGLLHPCELIIAEHFNIQQNGRPADAWLAEVVRWAWRVKLHTHLETDFLGALREKAEAAAIDVFAKNLKDLLLAAPAGQKATMGLDPGLRTGVKLAVVDSTGKVLDHGAIFPTPPQNKVREAEATVVALCIKHDVKLIAIGNGTASRETERFVQEVLKNNPQVQAQAVVVNESGASIYSASEYAAREFPNLDVTIRGAISIARRLQDPLAELVKIDPKSIGVGQYQHDVSQARLAKSLDAVVEDCVNGVGVEVNTASAPLLARVSGLNKTIASNIIEYRDKNGVFRARSQLKDVSRLGEKAFEQAAGFLRISSGENPLDASAVHPESYSVVNKIANQHKKDIQAILGDKSFLKSLRPQDYADENVGVPTITDIISELEKPGRDPRPEFKTARFKEGVEKMSDLEAGMVLEGVITNVTHFGAFVDIGVHQDGLVHISALSDTFVKDPSTFVKTGQIVKVKVMEIELKRKRIALSMRLQDELPVSTGAGEDNNASRGNRNAGAASRATRGERSRQKNAGSGGRASTAGNTQGTMAALFQQALDKKK